MGAFEPFEDFTATKAELAKLQKARDTDRQGNLERRMAFFSAQKPAVARQRLGFVPSIIENGFTCVGVPGEKGDHDLAFSVGLFYTFGFPELMILGESPALPVPVLNGIVQAGATAAVASGPKVVKFDDMATLRANAQKLVDALKAMLEGAPFAPTYIGLPDPKFLERYAYGYGWYFYRHFLDDGDVPLLLVRLGVGGDVAPPGPPVQVRLPLREGDEVLWALPLGEDHYAIDNFVSLGHQIAPGDVVRCKPSKKGLPTIVEVVERGPSCAIGLVFDEALAGSDLKRVVDAGLGMQVAAKDAPPPGPPSPEKTRKVLARFFESRVGEIVKQLHELGCDPHFLTDVSMGLSVPREEHDDVLAFLEDQDGVTWEVLCGPDAPAPWKGPFDPPEGE